MMGDIYTRATGVYSWLGQGEPDTDYAMRYIRSKCQQSPVKFDVSTILAGLEDVFLRRYWSRTWIVQECVLNPSLTILCGNESASFEALTRTAVELGNEWYMGWPKQKTELPQKVQAINELRLSDMRQTQMPLLQIAQKFIDRDCSDARDRVYAFRALTCDGQQLPVDYNCTLFETIILASSTCNRSSFLAWIAFIGRTSTRTWLEVAADPGAAALESADMMPQAYRWWIPRAKDNQTRSEPFATVAQRRLLLDHVTHAQFLDDVFDVCNSFRNRSLLSFSEIGSREILGTPKDWLVLGVDHITIHSLTSRLVFRGPDFGLWEMKCTFGRGADHVNLRSLAPAALTLTMPEWIVPVLDDQATVCRFITYDRRILIDVDLASGALLHACILFSSPRSHEDQYWFRRSNDIFVYSDSQLLHDKIHPLLPRHIWLCRITRAIHISRFIFVVLKLLTANSLYTSDNLNDFLAAHDDILQEDTSTSPRTAHARCQMASNRHSQRHGCMTRTVSLHLRAEHEPQWNAGRAA